MKGIFLHQFKTLLGWFHLRTTPRGLYSLEIVKGASGLRARQKIPPRIRPIFKRATREIRAYLRGKRVDFRNLPIDWRGRRAFEKKVLRELQKIPWGETATYQDLARRAGRPKAPRVVGRILHLNRLPFILPCHRIVPKNGGLGGFSQGVRLKRTLLKLERSLVDKSPSTRTHFAGRLTEGEGVLQFNTNVGRWQRPY